MILGFGGEGLVSGFGFDMTTFHLTCMVRENHGYQITLSTRGYARSKDICSKFPYNNRMRIIAGTLRGRSILAPDSDRTRPITDRAKQSLFDTLQDCFLDATVLDCFSGTGSMGLECLSRGAARAIFIERDRAALRLLRQNLKDLGLEDRALIFPIDIYETTLPPELTELTVAFVDPPYAHAATGHQRHQLDELIRQLVKTAMIDGGIISLRHPIDVTVDAALLGVKVVREFQYGTMGITWLRGV